MSSSAVLSGTWDDNLSWEFYLSDRLPDEAPCNAAFALAVIPATTDSELRVVMTRINRPGRGWEMPGGHLEAGETPEQGMIRECLEEGGYVVNGYSLFGYQQVTAKKPVANLHFGGFYPQTTVMAFYIATTDQPLVAPSGEEVSKCRAFSLDELDGLDTAHREIIRVGLKA